MKSHRTSKQCRDKAFGLPVTGGGKPPVSELRQQDSGTGGRQRHGKPPGSRTVLPGASWKSLSSCKRGSRSRGAIEEQGVNRAGRLQRQA